MRKEDVESRRFWLEERNILTAVDSPFINKLHFAFQNKTHLFLVTDLCICGNLRQVLTK